MASKRIQSALISVFSKEGLDPIIHSLHQLGVTLYSTGGTQKHIESLGVPVTAVESLTSFPEILDGRVKTLHPVVFGGILARREEAHLAQLDEHHIPEIDLVIVDLYPFEETVASTTDEKTIIEKIDIGGIALIRAAAKNHKDVTIVASKAEYAMLQNLLETKKGETDLEDRREFARRAFRVSSHYDTAIFQYFNADFEDDSFKHSILGGDTLRYGENPHQRAFFHGDLSTIFTKLHGKEISYNNMVDIDAAVGLMAEFKQAEPAFAILKHTNSCGVAIRPTVLEAWKTALACDPTSAFGGILISNTEIDETTAREIDKIFYEVLLAPSFSEKALEVLQSKKGRILLQIKDFTIRKRSFRSLFNGVIEQDTDLAQETEAQFTYATQAKPDAAQVSDMLFGNICVKHLKSNAIALVKDNQLIGMGCGQTSRVDSLKQAITKAKAFGFDLKGAVMASDAFFPFGDCVEIAHNEGIAAVIQPGGSIRDQDSIDYCDKNNIPMVITGVRHFRH